MGGWSSLLTSIAGLLSALIWPAVVVAVVLLFRAQIVGLLKSEDLSLTGPGGLSLVAKRKAVDATGALIEASRTRGDSPLTREQATAEVAETQRHLQHIDDPVVLSVDDIPSDTDQERYAMEALGISFDLSISTDDALVKLSRRPYDVIISDMGRPQTPARATRSSTWFESREMTRRSSSTRRVALRTTSTRPSNTARLAARTARTS